MVGDRLTVTCNDRLLPAPRPQIGSCARLRLGPGDPGRPGASACRRRRVRLGRHARRRSPGPHRHPEPEPVRLRHRRGSQPRPAPARHRPRRCSSPASTGPGPAPYSTSSPTPTSSPSWTAASRSTPGADACSDTLSVSESTAVRSGAISWLPADLRRRSFLQAPRRRTKAGNMRISRRSGAYLADARSVVGRFSFVQVRAAVCRVGAVSRQRTASRSVAACLARN